MIIVLEGIDGSGKSTIAKEVADILDGLETNVKVIVPEHLDDAIFGNGKDTLVFNEPGGTQMALEIRETLLKHREEDVHPITELLLYFAGRMQNVHNILRNKGKDDIIIIDRFVHSTLAYQLYGHQRTDLKELYQQLYEAVVGDFVPNLAYYIDISPETAMERLGTVRTKDRMESNEMDFYHRCRQGFLDTVDSSNWNYKTLYGTTPVEQLVSTILKDISDTI